ncbi:PhzF family phenazine biosynthesis protein [Pectobacterium actinidiae]|uniref:PhzF family phenazine biosynthesis protein n=1 Tax=Pectobacterium actinidiae TaxID=1507808 RepID=UPI004040AFCE
MTLREVEFRQVDVFTAKPFLGNPVAVIMDDSGLSSDEMQSVARWTNLSETTFVLPPQNNEAHYRLRIFTPGGELPFAGHPTIGTAHALLEAGRITPRDGMLIQECGAGNIPLRVEENRNGNVISFELPSPVITPLGKDEAERLELILRCGIDQVVPPALIDVGARWIVARLHSADAVLATSPDFGCLAGHNRDMNITGVCLYGHYGNNDSEAIEVRSFAPACGVNEDPVCGSGNGSVAAFMRYHATLPAEGQVSVTQGRKLGRDGHVSLGIQKDKILVGGQAVTCISGLIKLP